MTKQKIDKLTEEFDETMRKFRNYLKTLEEDFDTEIGKRAEDHAKDCLRVLKDSFEYIKFNTSAGRK